MRSRCRTCAPRLRRTRMPFRHHFLADAVAGHHRDPVRCHDRILRKSRKCTTSDDLIRKSYRRRCRRPLSYARRACVAQRRFRTGGIMSERHYWIGVVSKDHVAIGVAGGFTQLNHGKAGPLERMRAGDGFAFYSPRTAYPDGPPLQAFTAIGRVRDGEIFQAETAATASGRFAAPSSICRRARPRSSRSSTSSRSSAASSTGARRSASASCACRRTTSRASPRRWAAISPRISLSAAAGST